MKQFRIYGEGTQDGPRSQLLVGWREACRREELALEQRNRYALFWARVARTACEEALLDARRN